MQSFLCQVLTKKGEHSKSFESERFTVSVARVVNCSEKLDDCGSAKKWKWELVNSSWIGLVGDGKSRQDT